MRRVLKIALLFVAGASFTVPSAWGQQSASSGKRERGYIREGNKLYNDKRYPEAEVAYRKALQENEYSEVAMFNLASALIRQASLAAGAEDGQQNNPAVEAQKLFTDLAANAADVKLAENSLYNLGNMAFNQEQYEQSIDMYKRALRKNPDNDKARENLRLAQLKLEEQQNQDQNQDQDQQDDQNQDQQNDQNQDQQQNQDQNKDQNQDQNQDENQDQQNDQNQNQDQQQNQDQERKDDKNGISDRNAEQILKAMENEENATRRKIEARRTQEEKKNASKKKTDKPW